LRDQRLLQVVIGTMSGEITPVNDLVNLVSVFKYIKEKRETPAFPMKIRKLHNSCIS
jgi:hypothetical protein